MFLSMVIPGPSSLGRNIDVCLQPLIDELTQLWFSRALTYNILRKQNFIMRAALMWTINDFLAYGMVSGWSTHGKLACSYCMS
jgi:alcohol dehydrogenase YqhD (iron-dependent ADH family)